MCAIENVNLTGPIAFVSKIHRTINEKPVVIDVEEVQDETIKTLLAHGAKPEVEMRAINSAHIRYLLLQAQEKQPTEALIGFLCCAGKRNRRNNTLFTAVIVQLLNLQCLTGDPEEEATEELARIREKFKPYAESCGENNQRKLDNRSSRCEIF